MRLCRNVLRVIDAQRLADFYQDHLGMERLSETEDRPDSVYRHRIVLGYEPVPKMHQTAQAQLELLEVDLSGPTAIAMYQPRSTDVYWKIGITLPDVRRAQHHLTTAGVAASEPQQFRDIGFLCHLQDPEGFQIELLQHDFEVHHVPQPLDTDHVLGSRPTLGQITLRVTDIDANLHFYRDILGMTLLSIQPVEPYAFTLYFLAFTSDNPPRTDLRAVDNREWLWRRPYTTLELQHLQRHTPDQPPLHMPRAPQPGFAGIGLSCSDLQPVITQLVAHQVAFQSDPDRDTLLIHDPQGVPISIRYESELADAKWY